MCGNMPGGGNMATSKKTSKIESRDKVDINAMQSVVNRYHVLNYNP